MENLQTSQHHIRLNVLLLVGRLFSVLFIVNTVYGLAMFFTLWGGNINQEIFANMWVAHIFVFFIETGMVGYIVASWARKNYYLTEKELVIKEGILRERNFVYGLYSIRSISLEQGWIGRMLNYGTLTLQITASGGYHRDVKISGIKDPHKYEQQMRSGMYQPT